MTFRRITLLLVVLLGCGILPDPAATQSGNTITVNQTPPDGFPSLFGNWVLLKPDGTRTATNVPTHGYTDAPAGNYLLNVMPPSGFSASVTLTLNGETVVFDKPQAAFQMNEGGTVVLAIHYTLTLSGKVSIDTSPPGFPFTLTGPDGARYTGVSPGFYDPMPVGLYSVTFDTIKGCTTPSPQSGRLIKDGRVVLSVQLACDNLPQLEQQQAKDLESQFVKAIIDGKTVLFNDVPVGQWFTASVRRVLDAKVMSGYRDADGLTAGQFGPNDAVTLAELAKIAHRLVSIDETRVTDPPENDAAKGTWFAPFIASAEQRGWLVFLNRAVDPLRPATRAEVVATFLQALNVKRDWPTGAMFDDVSREIPYADCIETAATQKLVGGYTDDKGKPTGLFGPADPVNRASMAKIIATAMDQFLVDSPSFQPE
ncbi:MAG: S-layer homology domain-containing protein [Candidatus Peribacteraceae bacterium]|nr:S-layer homology domain-containing protein [Candidatus Peribacteraceae bacterium]MDD5742468.1 S-layer homology domain-containing protein [Candidatus Peribacteraceae bacterium]